MFFTSGDHLKVKFSWLQIISFDSMKLISSGLTIMLLDSLPEEYCKFSSSNVKENVDPTPYVLSNSILPPYYFMMFSEITNPKPIPLVFSYW